MYMSTYYFFLIPHLAHTNLLDLTGTSSCKPEKSNFRQFFEWQQRCEQVH